jgi:hypothetical protein
VQHPEDGDFHGCSRGASGNGNAPVVGCRCALPRPRNSRRPCRPIAARVLAFYARATPEGAPAPHQPEQGERHEGLQDGSPGEGEDTDGEVVRITVGAVLGVGIAAGDDLARYLELFDAGLERLEAGLAL